MKRISLRLAALCVFTLLGLAGCESTGYRTSVGVGTGYYHGGGWYDPYYYRPCCRGQVPVRPPPMYRPPMGGGRPVHLPSMARPGPSRF
jgi:hypothetical protein